LDLIGNIYLDLENGMEIVMKEIGNMIKRVGMEFILGRLEINILDNGNMIL